MSNLVAYLQNLCFKATCLSVCPMDDSFALYDSFGELFNKVTCKIYYDIRGAIKMITVSNV